MFLNLDRSTTPGLSTGWTTFAGVALEASPHWYFDLSAPDAAQQYFRAWHTNTQSPAPGLALHLVPALTLTGTPGTTLRLEYINPSGPVDAWVALDTVRLTNSPQLYFDISAAGQPPRLYRVTPAPQKGLGQGRAIAPCSSWFEIEVKKAMLQAHQSQVVDGKTGGAVNKLFLTLQSDVLTQKRSRY